MRSDTPRTSVTRDNLNGLLVWTGTWNLNACPVSSQDHLEDWLARGPTPDIVAVALQEVVELDVKARLFAPSMSIPQTKIDQFTKNFEQAMDVWNRPYSMVHVCSMAGQLLVVYIWEPLAQSVSCVDVDRVTQVQPLGTTGIFGNRGAVCIRFHIREHGSVCFCNVHLVSGITRTAARVALLRQIFMEAFQGITQRGKVRKPKHGFQRAGSYKVHQHDATFVMGDFNFHLIPGEGDMLSRDEFLNNVSADPWLHSNFLEATISFAPTYKYKVGTAVCEKRPGWCDRVLYGNSGMVRPIMYTSIPEMMYTSDHHAVVAVFLWTREHASVDLHRALPFTKTEESLRDWLSGGNRRVSQGESGSEWSKKYRELFANTDIHLLMQSNSTVSSSVGTSHRRSVRMHDTEGEWRGRRSIAVSMDHKEADSVRLATTSTVSEGYTEAAEVRFNESDREGDLAAEVRSNASTVGLPAEITSKTSTVSLPAEDRSKTLAIREENLAAEVRSKTSTIGEEGLAAEVRSNTSTLGEEGLAAEVRSNISVSEDSEFPGSVETGGDVDMQPQAGYEHDGSHLSESASNWSINTDALLAGSDIDYHMYEMTETAQAKTPR